VSGGVTYSALKAIPEHKLPVKHRHNFLMGWGLAAFAGGMAIMASRCKETVLGHDIAEHLAESRANRLTENNAESAEIVDSEGTVRGESTASHSTTFDSSHLKDLSRTNNAPMIGSPANVTPLIGTHHHANSSSTIALAEESKLPVAAAGSWEALRQRNRLSHQQQQAPTKENANDPPAREGPATTGQTVALKNRWGDEEMETK